MLHESLSNALSFSFVKVFALCAWILIFLRPFPFPQCDYIHSDRRPDHEDSQQGFSKDNQIYKALTNRSSSSSSFSTHFGPFKPNILFGGLVSLILFMITFSMSSAASLTHLSQLQLIGDHKKQDLQGQQSASDLSPFQNAFHMGPSFFTFPSPSLHPPPPPSVQRLSLLRASFSSSSMRREPTQGVSSHTQSLDLPFLRESVDKPVKTRYSRNDLHSQSSEDLVGERSKHVVAPNRLSSSQGIKSITRNDIEMRVGRKRRRRRQPRSLGMLSTLADGKSDLFAEQRFDPHHGSEESDQMTSGQSPLSIPSPLSSSPHSDMHPPPQQFPNDGETYTLSYDNGRDEEIHQLLKEWEESVLQHQSSPQIHQDHIPSLHSSQHEQELPHILHHLHHQLGPNDEKQEGNFHQSDEKSEKEPLMVSRKSPDRQRGPDDEWRMPADDPRAHPHDGRKSETSPGSISKEMADPIISTPGPTNQGLNPIHDPNERRHVQFSGSGRRFAPGHFGNVRLTPELIEKLYQYYKEIQSNAGNGTPGSGNPSLLLGSNVQASGAFTKRGEGPQLSIVNPLDVLRQRLLLEMARRRLKENQHQIQANERFLESLG